MNLNRGLVVLGAGSSLALCVAILILSAWMTHRHFEENARVATASNFHYVQCGSGCLVSMEPGQQVVYPPAAPSRTILITTQLAVDERLFNPYADESSTVRISRTESVISVDPDQHADVYHQVGMALPYKEIVDLLGAPIDLFYRPGEGELVAIYSEQIYAATRLTGVCEILPGDLLYAPTDVIYLADGTEMAAIRDANDNVGLDVHGYDRWQGEVNVSILCNIFAE